MSNMTKITKVKQTKAPIEMRVWWIPQVPMKRFTVDIPVPEVRSNIGREFHMVETAKLLITALTNYDLFQLENNIKPDYCNAGGLEIKKDGGEWSEWNNEDGCDIGEIMSMERAG